VAALTCCEHEKQVNQTNTNKDMEKHELLSSGRKLTQDILLFITIQKVKYKRNSSTEMSIY